MLTQAAKGRLAPNAAAVFILAPQPAPVPLPAALLMIALALPTVWLVGRAFGPNQLTQRVT